MELAGLNCTVATENMNIVNIITWIAQGWMFLILYMAPWTHSAMNFGA